MRQKFLTLEIVVVEKLHPVFVAVIGVGCDIRLERDIWCSSVPRYYSDSAEDAAGEVTRLLVEQWELHGDLFLSYVHLLTASDASFP